MNKSLENIIQETKANTESIRELYKSQPIEEIAEMYSRCLANLARAYESNKELEPIQSIIEEIKVLYNNYKNNVIIAKSYANVRLSYSNVQSALLEQAQENQIEITENVNISNEPDPTVSKTNTDENINIGLSPTEEQNTNKTALDEAKDLVQSLDTKEQIDDVTEILNKLKNLYSNNNNDEMAKQYATGLSLVPQIYYQYDQVDYTEHIYSELEALYQEHKTYEVANRYAYGLIPKSFYYKDCETRNIVVDKLKWIYDNYPTEKTADLYASGLNNLAVSLSKMEDKENIVYLKIKSLFDLYKTDQLIGQFTRGLYNLSVDQKDLTKKTNITLVEIKKIYDDYPTNYVAASYAQALANLTYYCVKFNNLNNISIIIKMLESVYLNHQVGTVADYYSLGLFNFSLMKNSAEERKLIIDELWDLYNKYPIKGTAISAVDAIHYHVFGLKGHIEFIPAYQSEGDHLIVDLMSQIYNKFPIKDIEDVYVQDLKVVFARAIDITISNKAREQMKLIHNV